MTDAEDSGTHEAAEENGSSDLSDESPERSHRDASISEKTAYESGKAQNEKSYKNNSKKIAAGKTGRVSGLEKAVSESNAEDSTYRQKTELFLNLSGYIKAAHSADSGDENDTPNGAVAIIYHRDNQTGELEFLFEQKPSDYHVPEAVGKLSFVGGAIQRKEKSLEALVRELTEEIEETAASTIIESLETNGSFYQRLLYEYHGMKGYSDIYAIEIKQEFSWNAVKHAAFKHDAGSPRVLRQNEVRVNDFAFGYGEIAKKFIDYNSRLSSNKTIHSLHSNQYLAPSLLPSLASSNIASLSPVQPYDAGM